MTQHLGSSLLEIVGQLLMLPHLGWALTPWCQGAWVICTGTLLFVWGRTLPPQPVFLTAETCSTPVSCSEYGFDLFSCSGCGDQVQGCLADTPGQQWLCNLHTLLPFFCSFLSPLLHLHFSAPIFSQINNQSLTTFCPFVPVWGHSHPYLVFLLPLLR